MPLSPDELITLPAEVVDLVVEIQRATSVNGEAGRKITRRERAAILRAVAHLTFTLTRDLVD